MRLVSFQVKKFRNIVDSGVVKADPQVTCLVGKNEAGKSGLLEALYLFNPAYDDHFDANTQYPIWLKVPDRREGPLERQAVIFVTLELKQDDLDVVSVVFGEDAIIDEKITVIKKYNGEYSWHIEINEKYIITKIIGDLPTSVQGKVSTSITLTDLTTALQEISVVDGEGPTSEDIALSNDTLTKLGLDKMTLSEKIQSLLIERLPKFFRFTNYSTLPGRIDLRELSKNIDDGTARTDMQTARALLSLAGTDIKQLANDDYELRRGELEAVQIDLTNQVFEYWKQNPSLEVQIDVDKETVSQQNGQTSVARFLDIRLRDTRSGYSNNFSQRSSGFQWFFSFLAAFSEFEGKQSPIVLLDEPALTLHGKAQQDFLRFINHRLAGNSSVIYTTHSPFMVEADHLERVRIVEDQGPPLGSVCTSDVMATDADSLFPLQAALGYDIAQNLFVGPHNLVVEGTSDYIYLTIMSQLCMASGRTGLDSRWRILPAGGATNIPTFVSLVGPHLDVTVLADSDTKGMQRVNNMIEKKLLAGHRLIFACVGTDSDQADIEDLFSVDDYLNLYNKTFSSKMKASQLSDGQRIVKRIEVNAKGAFDHGIVAETLLRSHQEFKCSDETLDKFAKLFSAINSTISN